MNNDADDEKRPRRSNWLTSTILIVIWVFGLMLVTKISPEIPTSMLMLGTIFFIVLIPAMNELVNSIERRISNKVSAVGKNPGKDRDS